MKYGLMLVSFTLGWVLAEIYAPWNVEKRKKEIQMQIAAEVKRVCPTK